MSPRTSLALTATTTLLSLLLLPLLTTAQTTTDCNPLDRTDCPACPALGTNATFDFTSKSASSDVWTADAGTVDYSSSTGGDYTINSQGDSIRITSKFYIFFGRVSVLMRAAPGRGIVSSIVMESDDLDEVDWELIGGNNSYVQSNYFGKGNTTSFDRAVWHPIDDPQGNFRNYTTVWTKEKLDWYIDDELVRTLNYEDALEGKNYPQTPMFVRLGLWAGGDPEKNPKGTVEWAGGETDFSQAPFTMSVKNVYVEDFSSGSKYIYGDKSGSYQSIKTVKGTSDITTAIRNPNSSSSSIAQRWAAIPRWGQIAIVCVCAGVGAALLLALIWYFIRQRRAGRVAHMKLQGELAAEKAEMLAYPRARA
jgi:beta-glucanase (GH16 family)